jgi:hypothetical protein
MSCSCVPLEESIPETDVEGTSSQLQENVVAQTAAVNPLILVFSETVMLKISWMVEPLSPGVLQQSPKVCGKWGAENANPSRGWGLPKPSFLGRPASAFAGSRVPVPFYVSLLLKHLWYG